MSLVYEALQKAEREKKRSAGVAPIPSVPVAPPNPPATAAVTPPAPAPRSYLPMLIVGVSVIAVAAIAYFVVTAMKNVAPVTVKEVPAAEPAAQPTPRAPETVTPPPVVTTENDSRFKLSGIMKTGDNYGAVINGHVVYDGNYVEGAVVKKVERDRVVLDLNGREITVRLF